MKLRTKVLQILPGVGKKSGAAYSKVKVLVEEGTDAQTGMVFWQDSYGALPKPGDVFMGEYGLAASEFGDLMLKLTSFAPVAASAASKAA